MEALYISSSIQTEAFGAVSTGDRRVSAQGNHRDQSCAERMEKHIQAGYSEHCIFGGLLSPGTRNSLFSVTAQHRNMLQCSLLLNSKVGSFRTLKTELF